MKKNILIIVMITILSTYSYAIDEILENSRYDKSKLVENTSSIIISNRTNKETITSDSNTINAILDNSKKFIYQALVEENSLLNNVKIQDTQLSLDKNCFVILESYQQLNKKISNKIIFFDIVNHLIVNAFSYEDNTRVFEKIYFINELNILIEFSDINNQNRYLEVFNLNDKNFATNEENAIKISSNISDIINVNDNTIIKLENDKLIVLKDGTFVHEYKTRGNGGKLIYDNSNNKLINLSDNGGEIFAIHQASGKYFATDFSNVDLSGIDFIMPLDEHFHEVIVSKKNEFYKLIDLKQLIHFDLKTTKNTILINDDKSVILTINPKKEIITLYNNKFIEIDDINFNIMKPRSNTLIEKIFFLDGENILIFCESGQLFELVKTRNRYTKSTLADF